MQKSPCERNWVESGFVSAYETGSECACEKGLCVRMTYLSKHGSTHVHVSVLCIPWSGT